VVNRQGVWQDHLLSWHINRLEMMVVFQALKHFLLDLRGHHVLDRMDITSVVSGSPDPLVCPKEINVSGQYI